MSVRVNNNTFELKITPNKRKRESIANANKENSFPFINFMEVKSISDLVKQKKEPVETSYEIARKPPKKKTKQDFDENCFVNPALNLNGPEKTFNPFEVKRRPVVESESHCFTNEGLDIRGAEREVVNPFEIHRDGSAAARDVQGLSTAFLQLSLCSLIYSYRNREPGIG